MVSAYSPAGGGIEMSFKKYILEICVDSVEAAIKAHQKGVSRLELCSNLIIGGTTPTEAFFNEVRKNVKLPLHVLIRPRFGDFLYSEYEVDIMKHEVIKFKELGASGIVIGMLDKNGDIDIENMKKLLQEKGDMKVTFHRAFDMCRNPIRSYYDIKALGVDMILTSGQKKTASEGRDIIKALMEIYEKEKRKTGEVNLPEIMMVGGFTLQNIEEILNWTNSRAVHMSAKKISASRMEFKNPNVNMGLKGLNEYEIMDIDEEMVKAFGNFFYKISDL